MYINMKSSKELINKLVKETLEQKYTNVTSSWSDLIDELSKEIKKPIELDDAGNYNVCDCEPYHISIRPIVHGICDVQAFKDYTDRTKKLFMKFDDVKKFVKEYLASKDLNYVDNALSKAVENSKDKEGGKKADKQSESEENVVNPQKGFKLVKNVKVENMNDPKDDPTQPMQVVGKFLKSSEYKSINPKYTPPTLPKALQKLVVKYTKGGKAKKK
jgi:hypothetical protein